MTNRQTFYWHNHFATETSYTTPINVNHRGKNGINVVSQHPLYVPNIDCLCLCLCMKCVITKSLDVLGRKIQPILNQQSMASAALGQYLDVSNAFTPEWFECSAAGPAHTTAQCTAARQTDRVFDLYPLHHHPNRKPMKAQSWENQNEHQNHQMSTKGMVKVQMTCNAFPLLLCWKWRGNDM